MKTQLAFGVLWLASARVITQDEEAPRATVLLQRAVVHPGPATVDVSADGRFVAFESAAALVPADRNRSVDIYVLDRSTGSVTLESMTPRAPMAMGPEHPRLSGDGRYLVFTGCAHGVPIRRWQPSVHRSFFGIDAPGRPYSCLAHLAGTPANGRSGHPDISDDGDTIVFESRRPISLMARIETVCWSDVYAFDVVPKTIARVSVDANGGQPSSGRASPQA